MITMEVHLYNIAFFKYAILGLFEYLWPQLGLKVFTYDKIYEIKQVQITFSIKWKTYFNSILFCIVFEIIKNSHDIEVYLYLLLSTFFFVEKEIEW